MQNANYCQDENTDTNESYSSKQNNVTWCKIQFGTPAVDEKRRIKITHFNLKIIKFYCDQKQKFLLIDNQFSHSLILPPLSNSLQVKQKQLKLNRVKNIDKPAEFRFYFKK